MYTRGFHDRKRGYDRSQLGLLRAAATYMYMNADNVRAERASWRPTLNLTSLQIVSIDFSPLFDTHHCTRSSSKTTAPHARTIHESDECDIQITCHWCLLSFCKLQVFQMELVFEQMIKPLILKRATVCFAILY